MAGILPGVQFIGEHNDTLVVILASRTYWRIDVEAFAERLRRFSAVSIGDNWNIQIGMYDHSIGTLRSCVRCDFKNILRMDEEAEHAYLYSIDTRWKLGTKCWIPADAMATTPSPAEKHVGRTGLYELSGHRLVDIRMP